MGQAEGQRPSDDRSRLATGTGQGSGRMEGRPRDRPDRRGGQPAARPAPPERLKDATRKSAWIILAAQLDSLIFLLLFGAAAGRRHFGGACR